MSEGSAVRPLRTILDVPAHDPDQLYVGHEHGADALWIDLEEPCAPFPEPEREQARGYVKHYLEQILPTLDDPPLALVRPQGITSGQIFKDLDPIVGPNLGGIILPKVLGAREVKAADAILRSFEVRRGIEPGTLLIWPILETAQALRNAYEIAAASPRVQYMGGGVSRGGDIVQALGYKWSAEGWETLMFREQVLNDGRAGGVKYPMSGFWCGDPQDFEGLRRFANQLRDIGYRGMMVNRTYHIPVINEVFTPTPDDIAYWQDLVRLADEAEASGGGPIVYGDPNAGEGHIVHLAHVGSARKNLAWAQALGVA